MPFIPEPIGSYGVAPPFSGSRSILQIGRVYLTESENRLVNDSGQSRILQLEGVESSAHMTLEQSKRMHDNLMGLQGLFVPVIFTDKVHLNGYYWVNEVTDEITWWKQGVTSNEWKISLVLVGADSEIDLESRISGPLTRTNIHSIIGERWNAASIQHQGYFTGTTIPSTITRQTSDGAIVVYRGIPVTNSPRWSCGVSQYELGRVRFLDDIGLERSGLLFKKSAIAWDLHNALIRVRVSLGSGVLEVSSWSGSAWQAKNYDIQIGGVSTGKTPISCNAIRNDNECVILRLIWALASSGRTQVDITLRRGSRFAELFISHSFSTTIKIVRASAEAGTLSSGTIRANVNDVNGHRYLIGSLGSVAADLTNGGIEKSSTIAMDAYIGIEFNASAPLAGDAMSAIRSQYAGAISERVIGVRR